MTRVLGLELVPAGFTITTEACVAYMSAGGRRDRTPRGVLLLRHERPDADRTRIPTRRHREPRRPLYQESGIIQRSPFATIDEQGVGALVRVAAAQAATLD
jgi:hypothetical protein